MCFAGQPQVYVNGEPHVPLSEVRELTPFGRWELVSQVAEEAGFYLKAINLPIDQVELISGFMNCLLEFGKLGVFLDGTERKSTKLRYCVVYFPELYVKSVHVPQIVIDYLFNMIMVP